MIIIILKKNTKYYFEINDNMAGNADFYRDKLEPRIKKPTFISWKIDNLFSDLLFTTITDDKIKNMEDLHIYSMNKPKNNEQFIINDLSLNSIFKNDIKKSTIDKISPSIISEIF